MDKTQPDLTSASILNSPDKDVGLVTSDIPGVKEKADRDALAKHIDQMWQQSIIEKGSIKSRWDQCEAFYRNQPPKPIENGYKHASNQHFPLIEPKVNTILANVCGTITAMTPYASAKGRANLGARSESLERDMHTMLQRAGFDMKVRELAVTAGNTNCAIARVTFDVLANGFPSSNILSESTQSDKIEYAGLLIDHIHPNDFGMYPLFVKDITKATMVGHRFFMTVGEIRENQIAGRFFADFDGTGGDIPDQYESGKDNAFSRTQQTGGAIQIADDSVECVAGILRADLESKGQGFRRYYEFIIARDAGSLLLIKHYDLPRPWYFNLGFKIDPQNFFSSVSLSQSMCALQIQYNSLNNLLIDGSWISAFPVAFVKKGSLPEGFSAYRPGEFYETLLPLEAQFLSIQFQIGAIPGIISNIERLAEGVAHVSPASEGRDPTSHISATYTSGQLQYQAAHLNEYAAIFGMGLQELVAFAAILIRENYTIIKMVYGDSIVTQSQDEWRAPHIWELTGKTPSNTAVQRIQMVQAVLAVMEKFPAVGNLLDLRQLILDMLDATQLPNADKIVRTMDQVNDKTIMQAAAEAIIQVIQTMQQATAAGQPINAQPLEELLQTIVQHLQQGGDNNAPGQPSQNQQPGTQQLPPQPGMGSPLGVPGGGAGQAA